MACTQLPADIQGCLNIPLVRGDDKEFTLTFTDGDSNPIDLTGYDIKMEVRQGGSYSYVVSVKTPSEGMTVSGNQLSVIFEEDDAVYQRDYGILSYDIAFTSGGITQHWIKGQITITKSITETWK
jgi:hypothetical protein